METVLAISNLFLGLFVILGFTASSGASVEIWGAIFLVVFALFLISKKLKTKRIIIGMAVKASLIGITLLISYSKSLRSNQGLLHNCKLIPTIVYGLKLCNRVALDFCMAICGLLIITVNSLLAANSFIASKRSPNAIA
ncbi:uncharacterized protein LOC116927227 [Daphnia magna]|uniref:Brain chitinase and chia n=2 Tax=Daphnia magna TaxID=35525 RepID=A0A0P6GCP3_9CRUS|nr:uncharacterized protein LOC116927227 [Daphnia magna]KAK4026479.1 hypothetical protein OUZ56_015475 [Daphnia magna]